MLWDPASPSEPPRPYKTSVAVHHVPSMAMSPIEGGVFLTLPYEASTTARKKSLPTREEVLRAAISAKPQGMLVHFDYDTNRSTLIAKDLMWPTGVAVPFGEDVALVLEPMAYRVRKISLDGKHMGSSKPFMWNLPAFPCAVAPASHMQAEPDFWVALCGPHRHPLVSLMHSHPLLKNLLGWLPSFEYVSTIFQIPTPSGHLMLVRVDKEAHIKEVLCDDDVDNGGIVPHVSFILQHANHLYVGGHGYPYLVMTNITKMPIHPRPQHLRDGEL